jgi:uncharacterized membrane protein YqhA
VDAIDLNAKKKKKKKINELNKQKKKKKKEKKKEVEIDSNKVKLVGYLRSILSLILFRIQAEFELITQLDYTFRLLFLISLNSFFFLTINGGRGI